MHPGEHAGPVELVQVATDGGGADVERRGELRDRHRAVGPHPGHDLGVALHLHPRHATNTAQNQPGEAGPARASGPQVSICAHASPCEGPVPGPPWRGAPHLRPAGTGAPRRRPRGRRVRAGHGLPRHRLHRAARPPRPGTEVWADGMGSCPGGIANLAVAASRLGLHTALGAAFGDDDYGDFCWRVLEDQERVDLSMSRRFPRWHSPVTVSMALDGDRTMITHGHEPPEDATTMLGSTPRARSVLIDLDGHEPLGPASPSGPGRSRPTPTARSSSPTWAGTPRVPGRPGARPARGLPRLPAQRRRGDGLHPHRHPERRPLRPRRPGAARRGHQRRATARSPSTPPPARRPRCRRCGSTRSTRPAPATSSAPASWSAPWPAGRWSSGWLRHPVLGLAVQQFGGSLAAPGWGDIADWWHRVREQPTATPPRAPCSAATPSSTTSSPTSLPVRCAGRPRPSPGSPTSSTDHAHHGHHTTGEPAMSRTIRVAVTALTALGAGPRPGRLRARWLRHLGVGRTGPVDRDAPTPRRSATSRSPSGTRRSAAVRRTRCRRSTSSSRRSTRTSRSSGSRARSTTSTRRCGWP